MAHGQVCQCLSHLLAHVCWEGIPSRPGEWVSVVPDYPLKLKGMTLSCEIQQNPGPEGEGFPVILCYPVFLSKIGLFDFWHPRHLSKLRRSRHFPLPRTVLVLFRRQSRGSTLRAHCSQLKAGVRPGVTRGADTSSVSRMLTLGVAVHLAHILSVLSLISFTQTFADSTMASSSSPTLPSAL